MTAKSCYGLLLGLILILCVLFAGCSSQNTSTTTAPVPTTQAGPKYTAGDIVTNNASSAIWLIVSYDSSSDLYSRALVVKNSDGTWGKVTGTSDNFPRKDMENLYPVLLTQVSVSSVPVNTPTVPTTVVTTLSGSGPLLTSISPTSGVTGTSATVTITGSNFQTGATVRLIQPGVLPVTATGVSVSSTQITGTFNLGSTNAGTANIQVTNPDGQHASLTSAFTIGAAPPVITGISPTSSSLGQPLTLTINGQNFNDIVSVTLVSASADGSQVSCTSPSTASTTVTCIFASLSVTPEVYNVQVMNSDGVSGWRNSSFTVNNATS